MKILSLLIAVIAASISVFASFAQVIETSPTVTDKIVIIPKRLPKTTESTRASDEINFTYA